MITREADYTIRTILYLARQGDGAPPVSSVELAREMDIPYRFLRKIVGRMVESGFVTSQRGKGGGLRLARPRDKVSLLDVLKAMDPRSITLNACLADDHVCGRSGSCNIQANLGKVQGVLDEKLADLTFDKLL